MSYIFFTFAISITILFTILLYLLTRLADIKIQHKHIYVNIFT